MSRAFAPQDGEYHGSKYNIYYHPENCGLKLLGEIETAGSYEFCTTIALRDLETGQVFLAQDSGCSCPTPFEDFGGTGDLIPYQDADQVRRMVDDHHSSKPASTEVQGFIRKITDSYTTQAKSLADIHKELEDHMRALGAEFLRTRYEVDTLRSLQELDEYLMDERYDRMIHRDAPEFPLAGQAIEDAINTKREVPQ